MPAPGSASDEALLAQHRERVQHLLLPMVARYEHGELAATPEGRAVLDTSPRLRASLALAALGGPRSGWTAAHLAEVPWSDQWPAELVRALVRRRIDWEPEAAALALRLVAATEFDDERIQLALKAADQLAETHPAHPGVMDGLDRIAARVQATPVHRYRVAEMRARVTRSIARHTPPGFVDLSPIADTDTWGPAAREVLRDAVDEKVDVPALLRCLAAAPSSTAPTARWLATLDPLVAQERARSVPVALVRLLVDLDVDPERPFVAVGNDDLARAAVWAVGHDARGVEDLRLLHAVVLRCSETNGQPHVTTALCGKAVGAAVTVLGGLHAEGPTTSATLAEPAGRLLEELWDRVGRGEVLRRIGRALGRDDAAIAARLATAKRAKAGGRPGPAATRRSDW